MYVCASHFGARGILADRLIPMSTFVYMCWSSCENEHFVSCLLCSVSRRKGNTGIEVEVNYIDYLLDYCVRPTVNVHPP